MIWSSVKATYFGTSNSFEFYKRTFSVRNFEFFILYIQMSIFHGIILLVLGILKWYKKFKRLIFVLNNIYNLLLWCILLYYEHRLVRLFVINFSRSDLRFILDEEIFFLRKWLHISEPITKRLCEFTNICWLIGSHEEEARMPWKSKTQDLCWRYEENDRARPAALEKQKL